MGKYLYWENEYPGASMSITGETKDEQKRRKMLWQEKLNIVPVESLAPITLPEINTPKSKQSELKKAEPAINKENIKKRISALNLSVKMADESTDIENINKRIKALKLALSII